MAKETFALTGTTLYAGKFYNPGDEATMPDDVKAAIAAKMAGTGRPMPPREVGTQQEASQHAVDAPEPEVKVRGKKKAEEG